ncbi:MAG: hypothetical protein H6825_03285 [Planctomycetes bacterium]|nr:hypothetical protein [Planctomycetota bacterium]
MPASWAIGLALLATVPPPSGDPSATVVVPLVLEGDLVPGVGRVTTVAAVAVNDAGHWLVEVDTDHPDTTRDGVLLEDGVVLLREGDVLVAPAGATVAGFGPVARAFASDGSVGLNLLLGGAVSLGDDSGLFVDGALVVQEGALVGAAGLSSGTTWKTFSAVHWNDAHEMLVVGTVDDPLLPSSNDRALVRLQLGPSGSITSAVSVVAEGDLLPGESEAVADLETDVHSLALDRDGHTLALVDLTGDPSKDHALFLDDTLLAQEGSPSPVAGRTWSSLANAHVDLASGARWTMSAKLSGDPASDLLLVKDGAAFVQEGDAPAFLGGFHVTDLGSSGASGPVFRGENGTLLWSARWDDPTPGRGKGLLLDDRLLVETGVSQVGGVLLTDVFAVTEGYVLSRDGRWVVFEGRLADGRSGAFLVYASAWEDLGHGLAGTGGKIPQLVGQGDLAGGSETTLLLSDALPNSSTNLVIGITQLGVPFKGGTMVPDADLLVLGIPLDAQGALTVSFPFPGGTPAGVPLWWQSWTVDPQTPKGLSASNALKSTTP